MAQLQEVLGDQTCVDFCAVVAIKPIKISIVAELKHDFVEVGFVDEPQNVQFISVWFDIPVAVKRQYFALAVEIYPKIERVFSDIQPTIVMLVNRLDIENVSDCGFGDGIGVNDRKIHRQSPFVD
jgi:hypothetical protein